MLVSHLWSPTTTTTTAAHRVEQQNARDVVCVCVCVWTSVYVCVRVRFVRVRDPRFGCVSHTDLAKTDWLRHSRRPKQTTGLSSSRSSESFGVALAVGVL